ncbi:MAG: glycosyltransferase [Actinomycetota bacterium]|nr:glycosyltransferase [Actinomycetota bacterium]
MPALSIGILSTYPPTVCGLATFSAALERALVALGHHLQIVRVEDGTAKELLHDTVAGVLVNGSASSVRRTAAVLSSCDVAIVQHEYGIFGGPDGDEVLEVLGGVDAPVIVVLHTVPQHASNHQAELLVDLCRLANRVVVMSSSARQRLLETYSPIDRSKVVTIPHGAALAAHVRTGAWHRANPEAELLTWGLLGPGKGIEHVIQAVGLLAGLGHPVRYTIAGATHPKVVAREGHHYRDLLAARADALGISNLVTFDDSYRDVEDLTEFIAGATIVVLPYDTVEQVTSGVLVDSIGAGRPIIATRFPHAIEMLSRGAGLLVPQQDPTSLAMAIQTATSDPDLLATMEVKVRELAPMLSWSAVAAQYAAECEVLMGSRQRMTA